MKKLCVLIVGENATNQFGGEAILPLHYFRMLHERGVEVYLITHERVKSDLQAIHELAHDHIFYVEDNLLFKSLNSIGARLPPRLEWLLVSSLIYLLYTVYQWFLIKRVVKQKQVNLIHQPTPVSPKLPSGVFGFGVPVIIGPMNGGMHFPPAFEHMAASGELLIFRYLRWVADGLKWLIPGKHLAEILLVANNRTKLMLTKQEQKKTRILPENGVLSAVDRIPERRSNVINCLFVGRLVDWKAVDIIIEAFSRLPSRQVALTIVGSGAEKSALKALVEQKQLTNVKFVGFVSFDSVGKYYQSSDIFLLPSLRECGGAVILEAMAHGLPVIATRWGGPTDYVTPETGILIPPVSRMSMVEQFARQIARLVNDPALRNQMGNAAIKRIKKEYIWQDKINKILKLYDEVV